MHAFANGKKAVRVKTGEEVEFTADIAVPPNTGSVTFAAWNFEKTNDFSHGETLVMQEDGSAKIHSVHSFDKPGSYFPVLKVKSSRKGCLEDIFVQCKNLDRVRVIVE